MKRRLHLTFPQLLIDEPVIYTLGKRFEIVTNIRRANVDNVNAWVILELEGEAGVIEAATAWLSEQAIQVMPMPDEEGA